MTWPRPPTPVRRWVMNVQGRNKFHPGSGSEKSLGRLGRGGGRDAADQWLRLMPRILESTWRRKRLRGFGELRIPYRPFVQFAAGRTLGPHRPRTDPQQGADFGRDPNIDRASCRRASEYQAFHGRPHTTRWVRPPKGQTRDRRKGSVVLAGPG